MLLWLAPGPHFENHLARSCADPDPLCELGGKVEPHYPPFPGPVEGGKNKPELVQSGRGRTLSCLVKRVLGSTGPGALLSASGLFGHQLAGSLALWPL